MTFEPDDVAINARHVGGNSMSSLVTLLGIPIMLLNAFGGVVSLVWLAFLGEWHLIGWAIVAFLLSTFFVGFLLVPSMLLGAPALWLFEKGLMAKVVAALLMFASSLWTYGVMAAWCIGSFYFVFQYLHDGWRWPHLLLAYSLGTGPWAYLASKEGQSGDNLASGFAAFALCVGAFCLILVLGLSHDPSGERVLLALLAPLALALLMQWFFALAAARSMARPF